MYQTLKVTDNNRIKLLTISRPQQRNSINHQLLCDLQAALTEAERDPSCRVVALQGEGGFFCTGMDFEAVNSNKETASTPAYMEVLKRFTTTPKVIISLLDGQVLAGGVGFAAASDLVLSNRSTQFGLSEALWGLLPACVTPFLIRRIGFQKAYRMTLTTETLSAEQAYHIGLIDELSDNLAESLRRLMIRLNRIEEGTIHDLKSYFQKMWIIDENMEKTAVAEITRLVQKPSVQQNIRNFLEFQRLPWEKEGINA